MAFTQSYIPYGAYWSTPFCRWPGALAHLYPLRHAATVGAVVGAEGVTGPTVSQACATSARLQRAIQENLPSLDFGDEE